MASTVPAPTASTRLLPWSARAWFLAALIGQWLFAVYIGWTLVRPLMSSDAASVDDTHLITGHIEGDTAGNAMLLGHVLAAAIINLVGLLQLVPAIRRRHPSWHRWAIRAFLLVSGVWTLRLGLMAWVIINQGPNGNTPRLDGAFDSVWVFGCYLLPLAIAELYFRAETGSRAMQFTAAGMLALSAAFTLLGTFAAFAFMWLPRF